MEKTKQTAALAMLLSTTMLMTSCSEKKSTSTTPTFDKVVTNAASYQKGADVSYTVTFKEVGENIGGTYKYAVTGLNGKTLLSGETARYAPVNSFSETFKAPDSVGTFTLTVSGKMMAAYAGDSPYLDPSSMGSINCTFNVIE
ncbi:MAG: hypothetical protein IJV06_09210 [Bacteroidaceae bacterium]|nr:hypothetical protein [Bacteroidaceae bacterium]